MYKIYSRASEGRNLTNYCPHLKREKLARRRHMRISLNTRLPLNSQLKNSRYSSYPSKKTTLHNYLSDSSSAHGSTKIATLGSRNFHQGQIRAPIEGMRIFSVYSWSGNFCLNNRQLTHPS